MNAILTRCLPDEVSSFLVDYGGTAREIAAAGSDCGELFVRLRARLEEVGLTLTACDDEAVSIRFIISAPAPFSTTVASSSPLARLGFAVGHYEEVLNCTSSTVPWGLACAAVRTVELDGAPYRGATTRSLAGADGGGLHLSSNESWRLQCAALSRAGSERMLREIAGSWRSDMPLILRLGEDSESRAAILGKIGQRVRCPLESELVPQRQNGAGGQARYELSLKLEVAG